MANVDSSTLAPTDGQNYFSTASSTDSKVSSPAQRSAPKDVPTLSRTGDEPFGIRFEPTRKPHGKGVVDPKLIKRASELLEDIESSAIEQRSLAVESLRCVACELWTTAAGSSQYHQSVLALIEGMLLTIDDLDHNRAASLRGAFADLRSKTLNESHVDIIRSRFVDEGYNPLSILSAMEELDDNVASS